MESLIFPVALLLLFGLWAAFQSGRKFRNEFRTRGIDWAAVSASLAAGQGTLAVDTIWGPQRGLGHPTIWWLQEPLVPGESLASRIETGGSARLVKCPAAIRTLAKLQQTFGTGRVVAHTWEMNAPLVDAQQ